MVSALIVQVGNAIHFRPFQQYLANPIVMAIVGISICYAAYMAEIVRAGIEALPTGQMEAARSLGMTKSQSDCIYRRHQGIHRKNFVELYQKQEQIQTH